MKSSQWIGAVVVLALVVFGITFFGNYSTTQDSSTSEIKKQTGGDKDIKVTELDFPDKLFPQDTPTGPVPLPYEVHKQGIHDFWFEETKEPVTVGLNRKTCKCTTVELFVLNDQWKTRRSELEKAGP